MRGLNVLAAAVLVTAVCSMEVPVQEPDQAAVPAMDGLAVTDSNVVDDSSIDPSSKTLRTATFAVG